MPKVSAQFFSDWRRHVSGSYPRRIEDAFRGERYLENHLFFQAYDVDEKSAKWVSEYKGKKYYFCAPGCKKTFEEDPEKYIE